MGRPLCIDLFCGLGGWAEGFLAEGWDVIGFDIERHDYGTGVYPGQLVLQDVMTLHSFQFRNADCIVASPPCQEFSYYHRFPWKAPEPKLAIELFKSAFRIAEQAGKPLIVENVVGAQRWVGPSKYHWGSYHLWGDIPALMPHRLPNDGRKGFGRDFESTPWAWYSSKSKARKAASAQIAKIPLELAMYIARVYKREAEAYPAGQEGVPRSGKVA